MWCVKCGRKIGVSEPKITTAEGHRCSDCEYRIQMGLPMPFRGGKLKGGDRG